MLAKTDALPSEPAPTLLSKGRPYTVSVPAGAAGSWSDPDDGVKLTDGVTVADPRYFNADRNLYTGRSNGSGVDVPVSTVIDLGAQKAIHQVSATFVVNSDYALLSLIHISNCSLCMEKYASRLMREVTQASWLRKIPLSQSFLRTV